MNKMIRNKFSVVSLVLFAGVIVFSLIAGFRPAVSEEASNASAWTVRCQEKDSDHCEIFQRLIVQETGVRVAEFAVGFPEGKSAARGVMILPLGILLPDGVQMQIDDQPPFKFKVRFCAKDGCFAYLNLNETVLDFMRKGNTAVVTFKTLQGQDMDFPISLKGFTKALADISS